VLSNLEVQEEIRRLQAVRRRKTGYTRAKAEQQYQLVLDMALVKGDLSTAVAAIKGTARLYGLDSDKMTVEHGITPLSPADRDRLEAMAREFARRKIASKEALNRGTIAGGAS